MASRLPRHISGERVLEALIAAKPGRLSTAQLTKATGLSPNQVRAGLVWVKEYGALQHAMPLTWTRDGHGVTDEPQDWIAHERTAVHGLYTRVLRLVTGTAEPHAHRTPEDPWIRLYLDQLTGVRAFLDATSRLPPPTPAGIPPHNGQR
ncbi:hypothetical protein A5731_28045 [Mycolicibacterium conceptionense]|jgi:hypothetical protein|uniref:Uncharacterized protein n=4 Tax=Mycolicibacterium TaxID=1866885 RepID=A0A0J8TZJ5_9MYCO|nr:MULTISPECIES: hypothetical protein [Mycolicibacterium]KLI04055.1 hypothetical protein AA982_32135 [Mycolicibacterium senegalense]KLO50443.1 hypothetical protein ABW05_01855 [Mycolicibacterium senegalense]KMV13640.1 hypothetical protein ACT17_34160 [Mycolicibacterium conceptionense]MCV7200674.1 hypothetical protein [Mycolicibacterium peregrinum]MCW1824063.1 hypothetical protein [Mycolicibacterium senegalense]